jgi:hypothetical protein
MRLIKAFLVGAIGLFIVITLLSLLIPSTVKVSRTTLINNTTSAKVLDQVVNLSNWKNWHPVFKNSDTNVNIYCLSHQRHHSSLFVLSRMLA